QALLNGNIGNHLTGNAHGVDQRHATAGKNRQRTAEAGGIGVLNKPAQSRGAQQQGVPAAAESSTAQGQPEQGQAHHQQHQRQQAPVADKITQVQHKGG